MSLVVGDVHQPVGTAFTTLGMAPHLSRVPQTTSCTNNTLCPTPPVYPLHPPNHPRRAACRALCSGCASWS
jgi:hypothetical protein